ncbi:MAG: acyl-CoA dehydrogenase [Alphaproteobacteria bacterium]|nr:acyl-CoA dehydrogenase [Alphaproteobacteria bacterium]
MRLALSAEDEAFRAEVRQFLSEKLTPDLREAARLAAGAVTDAPVAIRWQKVLYEKGWVAPAWPKEYGGPGWSEMQRYIFASESAAAGAPGLPPFGLRMVGPVIMKFARPEQKAHYLPRILAGEDYWCQGYSEPGSGSDLASLQTRAVRDGDDYVINGTKIWTTHAHFADHMFCLVRTDSGGKPQEGISFVLIDMKTPGIKVAPIITIAGDHEVNQVFFDDVRVPVANRIGEEGQGWTIAKYLLEFERGNAYAAGLKTGLAALRRFAGTTRASDGDTLLDDEAYRRKLIEAEIDLAAIEMTENRIMSALSTGQNPGPASSMLKTRGTEMSQRLSELGIEAIGYYGGVYQPEAREPGRNAEPVGPEAGVTLMPKYLNTRAASIYGGSNEVQRNIMAKLVLGL